MADAATHEACTVEAPEILLELGRAALLAPAIPAVTVEAGADVLTIVLVAVELILVDVEVAPAVALTEGREAVEVSRKLV
jgi:hypothetical protein